MKILIALLLLTGTARADVTFLGFARRVPRTWSASRDAPAFNLMVVPRNVRTAGSELTVVALHGPTTTTRFGFYGLLELESDGETTGFGNAFPEATGALLWRGSYGYYAALSLDAIAQRRCDGCAFELSAQYRHESQHYTGSNSAGTGEDNTDQPFVGDDVILDVAASAPRGDWLFAARAVAFAFLPGRSSYLGGPAIDLHVRWRGWKRVQPFVSGYAEELFGTQLEARMFDNAYLVRALAGVALPSTLGDVMVYVAADAGNRKGIRGLTEEATIGAGIRLALGAAHPDPDH